MGLWMSNIEYLSDKGFLPTSDCRILDIGSQNLYFATPESIRSFVEHHGSIGDEKAFAAEAERIAYFSTPRPGERTAYVSELFDLTPKIFYTSYDVSSWLSVYVTPRFGTRMTQSKTSTTSSHSGVPVWGVNTGAIVGWLGIEYAMLDQMDKINKVQ